MSIISLRGITKNFGQTPVLKGIDLDIADGEFLTLVGASGCGKSTLLRIIAGLENQTDGDVKILGESVNSVRASQRDLAMVFQSYALYPHLTVRQNMLTPLLLRDLSFYQRLPLVGRAMPGHSVRMDALRDMVEETAAILKIKPLLDRKPGQLSGGQRQRVALGRAMVRKPTAFLMDEPLSNLDAALRVHMRAELSDLHRSLRATFIYVTHDQSEALTMSNRMAVMIDGRIVQLGTPDEVYGDPQDIRVAEFVGSPKINIIPGRADAHGRVTAYGTPLHKGLRATNCNVSVCVRPEHLQIAPGPENEGWPFLVTHKENMGSDFFLHGNINGSDHRIVGRFHPSAVAEIAPGDSIYLRATAGTPIVFGEDGLRMPLVAN
ncbi:MAG: ABC transporter ATP-binding protein [Rhodospirillaceae bacterium TMED63]|nr:MAG: ABC transporter ATP-binding protein [Rhodospirillaceae bacterium TMED63]